MGHESFDTRSFGEVHSTMFIQHYLFQFATPYPASTNLFPFQTKPRRQRFDNEKTFWCDFPGCGKGFFFKNGLVRHKKLKHTGYSDQEAETPTYGTRETYDTRTIKEILASPCADNETANERANKNIKETANEAEEG